MNLWGGGRMSSRHTLSETLGWQSPNWQFNWQLSWLGSHVFDYRGNALSGNTYQRLL